MKEMKKTNKKGFTLIELLAVIIILGVLMIIAIPSVTEYISSSRKKAYIDIAGQYISTVITKVNQAENLKFFEENTLYLVKVGHEKACVSLEKGGQSPFNDTWKYAYVGVVYTGSGYDYYYMSEDASGEGIRLVLQKELKDSDYDDLVKTDTPDYSGLYASTTSAYLVKEKALYTVAEDGTETAVTEGYKDIPAAAGFPENVTTVVVVNGDSTSACQWPL